MKRSEWKKPVSTAEAYRRAGGRARYNDQRARVVFQRQQGLLRMLGGYAPVRGELGNVARRLGVSKATASRDVALLRRAGMLKERMTLAELRKSLNSLI